MQHQLGKKQQLIFDELIKWVESNQENFMTNGVNLSPRVLLGGGGVGKTMLITHLCQQGYRVGIATTTNKAAQVVRDMFNDSQRLAELHEEKRIHIPHHIETIHKFLGVRPKRQQDGTTKLVRGGKPILSEEFFDLIIIDESSMADIEIKERIQHDVIDAKNIPVLYVGDPCQLPPVGYSESPVFEDYKDNTYKLKKVYRQKKNNALLDLATAVRAHQEKGEPFPYDALYSERSIKDGEGHAWIDNGDRRFLWRQISRLMNDGKEIVYLGYTNKTTTAVAQQMRTLVVDDEEMFLPGETYISNKHTEAVEGQFLCEEVLTNNEYVTIKSKTEIMMPSRAAWYDTTEDLQRVNAKFPERNVEGYHIVLEDGREGFQPVDYAHIKSQYDYIFKNGIARDMYYEFQRLDTVWDLRLPHALTIHKAQGSAFDYVVIDLEDMNSCLYRSRGDYARLLYTALTRAKKMVILYGSTEY